MYQQSKSQLGVCLCCALFACQAMADDVVNGLQALGQATQSASPHHLSANAGVYSDYLFRGISYGRGRGAFQASIDYAHDHGFFLGLGYTNVNKDAIYGNTYEIDLYGGYKTTFADDLTLTAGFIEYYYPQNKHYVGQHPHVGEVNLALDYHGFNAKYSHSLTDWFGVNTVSMGHAMVGNHEMGEGGSKGSHYVEVSYTMPLANTGIHCVFHVGHQVVKNYYIGNYTDYSVGINKDFSIGNVRGWNAGVSYVAIDANDDWYTAADGYKTAQNKFFGYLRFNM